MTKIIPSDHVLVINYVDGSLETLVECLAETEGRSAPCQTTDDGRGKRSYCTFAHLLNDDHASPPMSNDLIANGPHGGGGPRGGTEFEVGRVRVEFTPNSPYDPETQVWGDGRPIGYASEENDGAGPVTGNDPSEGYTWDVAEPADANGHGATLNLSPELVAALKASLEAPVKRGGPALGLATTQQLIEELAARAMIATLGGEGLAAVPHGRLTGAALGR